MTFGARVDVDFGTYDKCVIYTDSQPAIIATTKPGQQSGQSILTSVIDAFETLQSQQSDIEISLVWVPGHMDIAGNEEADKAAKEAARSRDTNGGTAAVTHKTMKSARNQTIERAAKMEWKIGWEKGKATAQHLRRITTKTEMEAHNTHKLYNSITKRPDIAMLSRLRTGHCFLNQYLHRFHHEDSPECTCGSGALETVVPSTTKKGPNSSKTLALAGCGSRSYWVTQRLLNSRWNT